MISYNLIINNIVKGRLNKIDQLLDSNHDTIQLRNRNQTTDDLPRDSFVLWENKNVYCMFCTLQKFSFKFCSADNKHSWQLLCLSACVGRSACPDGGGGGLVLSSGTASSSDTLPISFWLSFIGPAKKKKKKKRLVQQIELLGPANLICLTTETSFCSKKKIASKKYTFYSKNNTFAAF